MNFATLPNLFALAVLVAVFWAISRKATSQQIRLWLLGWMLILVHFAAELPAFSVETWARLATAVSLDSLILAGVAFLISVSAVASNSRRRWLQLALAIGVPAIAYTNGAIWGIVNSKFYYLLIAIGLLAPLRLFLRYQQRGRLYSAGAILAALLAAGFMCWQVARGAPELGITLILTALNFSIAILYWAHHRRISAGILTAVSGFALWGSVFPAAVLQQMFAPTWKIDAEVWNIPKYLVAVGMIFTLLEDQIKKSTYLAYHDELTDLPNRRLLEDRMEQALAQAKRSGGKLAVFILDLDHFKQVNDTFGHRVGDLALREVVARLASRVRASDTLARSGGDEFTVVSQVASAQAAEALSSALESALAQPLAIENKEIPIGLSIGLALFPDDGTNADQLCAAADRAMYTEKRAGRSPEPAVAMRQSAG